MLNNRTWLAFANRKRCRHTDAIHSLGFINWRMGRARFSIGDIVYLFMSDERYVRFKMVVTAGIEVDEKGYVKVVDRPFGMTTRRGVFAGGDVVHRPQTVVLAMKAAKEVAQGIAQYVDAIKLLEEAKRIEKEGTCS